jgi:hypothetical protein
MSAVAADPGGDPTPGIGGGSPPGGPATMTYTYTVGAGGFDTPETFAGAAGVQDTFVFQLGNYVTLGSTSSIDENPSGLSLMQMGMAGQYDQMGNFEQGVDKIRINGREEQGLAPLTSLADGQLESVSMMGGYFLVTTDDDIVVASTFEITDSDLTTV